MKPLTLKGEDDLILHATLFHHSNPKAIVQLIPGSFEHKELYYPFAEFLNQHGYIVVVSDNRGQGESVNSKYPSGHIEGIAQYVQDAFQLTQEVKKTYPHLPVYLFGHSLGSIIARIYLQEHDNEIEKLAMVGTVCFIFPVGLAFFIGKLIITLEGQYGHSWLLNQLGGATRYVNPPYEKNWVTSDKENYEALLKDSSFQMSWDNSGATTVYEGDYHLKKYHKYRCQNPELKIASFTGEEDPLTGGEKGIKATIRTLKKIGYRHIQWTVYPKMKHALLMERNREEVFKKILEFFDEG